jgi:hypothetical protein
MIALDTGRAPAISAVLFHPAALLARSPYCAVPLAVVLGGVMPGVHFQVRKSQRTFPAVPPVVLATLVVKILMLR